MEKQIQDDGSTFEENIKFRLYLAMVLLGLLEFSRPIIGGEINAISITDIVIGIVLIIVGIQLFKKHTQLKLNAKKMKEFRFFTYYLFLGISVPFFMFGFHVYGDGNTTIFSAIMMGVSAVLWIGIFIYFRRKIKAIEVTE